MVQSFRVVGCALILQQWVCTPSVCVCVCVCVFVYDRAPHTFEVRTHSCNICAQCFRVERCAQMSQMHYYRGVCGAIFSCSGVCTDIAAMGVYSKCVCVCVFVCLCMIAHLTHLKYAPIAAIYVHNVSV